MTHAIIECSPGNSQQGITWKMDRSMHKKMIDLIAVIVAISLTAGCGKKTPETIPHHESGSCALIVTDIYEECMANNDVQGAKDVLESYTYLMAFCCGVVNYDDVKNKDYNNIQYDTGDLQLAVAAYNEYNEESAMDVEVGWICQFNSCTQEQHDAVDAYVEWFHKGQNVTAEGLVRDYRREFDSKYTELKRLYEIPAAPAYDNLTPAQFREVQNYMKDPSYQVDTSVWD